jgi:hypothetical protein
MQLNQAAGADHTREQQQQLQQDMDRSFFALPPAPPPSALSEEEQKAGSGIIYGTSGAELPVSKVAVGQQLEILDQLQRRSDKQNAAAGAADARASASGAGAAAVGGALAERGISEAEDVSEAGVVAAVCNVRPEQLADVEAVAQGDRQAGMTQP